MTAGKLPPAPVGSALIWKVQSDEPGEPPYTVELDSYSGNGECTCPHFNMRLRPQLARGAKAADLAWEWIGMKSPDTRDAYRCKHIVEARRALADQTIDAFTQAKRAHPPS
jgi:hypothetical protein